MVAFKLVNAIIRGVSEGSSEVSLSSTDASQLVKFGPVLRQLLDFDCL